MIATVGLAALAMTVDKWRNEYFAEKDATLRHYIELHPEDFPTPGKKQFVLGCSRLDVYFLLSYSRAQKVC